MSNRFLLEAKNIIKTFPPTVALNDVHFCLRPGEIHGLMGENGSGKSTMCSIVSGIYPYDSGELFLDGEPYCPKNMIDAAAKGVCMIVQEQGTFASTTVAENIFIGKEKQFHNGIRLDTKKMANAPACAQFTLAAAVHCSRRCRRCPAPGDGSAQVHQFHPLICSRITKTAPAGTACGGSFARYVRCIQPCFFARRLPVMCSTVRHRTVVAGMTAFEYGKSGARYCAMSTRSARSLSASGTTEMRP